jgi:hypothetical protein
MSNTDNPALINANQENKKSIELGHISPTHFDSVFSAFDVTGDNFFATAIEPLRRSWKAITCQYQGSLVWVGSR